MRISENSARRLIEHAAALNITNPLIERLKKHLKYKMIELGTIVVDNDRRKRINVYKDKQHVGEVTVSVTAADVEEKLLNALKLVDGWKEK